MPDEESLPRNDEVPYADSYKGIDINTYERGRGADAKYLAETISAWIKAGFSSALIVISLVLFGFGGYTSWNHKDAKIRESAISLMAVPAGLVAGLLGGIGLR
jgi:hypothetical protein